MWPQKSQWHDRKDQRVGIQAALFCINQSLPLWAWSSNLIYLHINGVIWPLRTLRLTRKSCPFPVLTESTHSQLFGNIPIIQKSQEKIHSLFIFTEHQEGNAFDVWTIGKNLIFYFTLSMQTVLEGHFRNIYVCVCVCVEHMLLSTSVFPNPIEKKACWHWATLIYIWMKLIRNKDLGHIPLGDLKRTVEYQHTWTWQSE